MVQQMEAWMGLVSRWIDIHSKNAPRESGGVAQAASWHKADCAKRSYYNLRSPNCASPRHGQHVSA